MIDWMAFLTVFVAALGSAVFVVVLYSLGIRFLAIPAKSGEANGPSRDDEDDDIEEAEHPRWATNIAYLFFGLSALAVVAGIFLIIPALHPW
ncbi:hypothetical protein ACXR2T_14665 [Leucobacter sp. HY1910]